MARFRSSSGDNARWTPTTTFERYDSIDILRGLALFGVLVVNLQSMFRIPLLEHILGSAPASPPLDNIVDFLVVRVLEFKAVTIFSFLFGVGIAIQEQRAAHRNIAAKPFLFRRM